MTYYCLVQQKEGQLGIWLARLLVRSLVRLLSLFLSLSSDNVLVSSLPLPWCSYREHCVSFLLYLAHGSSCCCMRWCHKALPSCTPKLHSAILDAPGMLWQWYRRHSPYYINVSPQWFWSCYCKVKLLHSVTLIYLSIYLLFIRFSQSNDMIPV